MLHQARSLVTSRAGGGRAETPELFCRSQTVPGSALFKPALMSSTDPGCSGLGVQAVYYTNRGVTLCSPGRKQSRVGAWLLLSWAFGFCLALLRVGFARPELSHSSWPASE